MKMLNELVVKYGDRGYVVYIKLLSFCAREGEKKKRINEFLAICNDHPCADVATLNIECYNPLILTFWSFDRGCKIMISRELGLWSIATNKDSVTTQRSIMVEMLNARSRNLRRNPRAGKKDV
jgi:hypothetical protein